MLSHYKTSKTLLNNANIKIQLTHVTAKASGIYSISMHRFLAKPLDGTPKTNAQKRFETSKTNNNC